MLNKTDVFVAGEGMPCYRIPGIIRTARGTLIVYCEARTTGGDWDAHGVILRRSEDGVHFQESVMAAFNTESTINNPVMIARRDGGIILLWHTDYGQLYRQISLDDGVTFSRPESLDVLESYRSEYDWTCAAVGPGHGIETESGMLLVPVWLARGEGRNHWPSVLTLIRSFDGGLTWQRGAIVYDQDSHFYSPNETVSAQLPDGRIYLTIRHKGDLHRRFRAYTTDGCTVTTPEPDMALCDPQCFGSAACAGSSLLISNCDNEENARIRLTIRESADGGLTWAYSRILEEGVTGYSDLMTDGAGRIWCLYERGYASETDHYPAALTLASFDTDWVQQ